MFGLWMLQYQKSGDASHLQNDVLIQAVTGLRKVEKIIKELNKKYPMHGKKMQQKKKQQVNTELKDKHSDRRCILIKLVLLI